MHIIKILQLGDTGIGKTYIANKLCNRDISNIRCTIGVEFNCITININKNTYKFNFWDCTGNPNFGFIIDSFIKLCNVFVIYFDPFNKNFKTSIQFWLYKIRCDLIKDNFKVLLVGFYKGSENIKILINSNKLHNSILKYLNDIDIDFLFVNDENIYDIFNKITGQQLFYKKKQFLHNYLFNFFSSIIKTKCK